MAKASPTPGKSLLSPNDHVLIMIDHQPQMAFATRSIGIEDLRNNCSILAKAAKGFNASTILTCVASKSFAGPIFPEIQKVFPEVTPIERTTMNSWEDKNFCAEINRINKPRLVFSGLWTSVCIAGPVISAIEQGFETYVISDACGDVSKEAHEMAIQRMVSAGARTLTSLTYMLELQRDWARSETYAMTTGIAKDHGGGYGLGLEYAHAMFHGSEAQTDTAAPKGGTTNSSEARPQH